MNQSTGRQDFEEMEVWKDAQNLAIDVFRDFTAAKDYSFANQIKRAVVSISNNIAEGAERHTFQEFARFLDISKGSTGEVRSMYRLAEQLGMVHANVASERTQRCMRISRQLGGFSKYLRKRHRAC